MREVTIKFRLGDDVTKEEFDEWLQTADDHVDFVDTPTPANATQLASIGDSPEDDEKPFDRDPDEPTAHIARGLDELANYGNGEHALVDMLSCAWLALSRARSATQRPLQNKPWPSDTRSRVESAHDTVSTLLHEEAGA